MKNTLFLILLISLTYLLCLPVTNAQWTEVPHPIGPWIADGFEYHAGKVYASFYYTPDIVVAATEDFLHWEKVASLPGTGDTGKSFLLPDGEKLYVFGRSLSPLLSVAYVTSDGGDNWQAVNLPTPKPNRLLPLDDVLVCAANDVQKW